MQRRETVTIRRKYGSADFPLGQACDKDFNIHTGPQCSQTVPYRRAEDNTPQHCFFLAFKIVMNRPPRSCVGVPATCVSTGASLRAIVRQRALSPTHLFFGFVSFKALIVVFFVL